MKALPTFLLTLCAGLSFSFAADYNEFYIFGDSLSDAGNTPNMEPYNVGGRFTNGKVWNEYLAEMLGMPVPTKSDNYKEGDAPSTHATNFARGGAMTNKGPATFNIPSVFQQIYGRVGYLPVSVERYGKNFGEDDLVSIWAGANNLFFSGQTKIAHQFEKGGKRAADEQAANIRRLIAKGAKKLIIFNLPDIGKTPCFAVSAQASGAATLFSKTFNATIAAYIELICKEHPEVEIIPIDVEAIFAMLYTEPEKHGFKNATDQLVKQSEEDMKGKSPDDFVFYDDVHPTTAAHRFIAEQVYNQLAE